MTRMQALVGAKAFDAVLGTGQRITRLPASAHFSLHYLTQQPATETQLRVGFIIAKKLSRQAARRNLIRRVWKAELQAMPLYAQVPHKIDLVIRQRAAIDMYFVSASSHELKALLKQEARALIKHWQALVQPLAAAEANSR